MRKKQGVYERYTVLEDVSEDDDYIHMNLAKLDLDIIKDVEVSYFYSKRNNANNHKTERISFKEFQYRILNDKEFRENNFFVYLEGKDYGIELSGGEMWVFSDNVKTAESIYGQLIL